MKRLIKVIRQKVLRRKKGADKENIKFDKKFNFKFRRTKLDQNISLRSFPNYQQYTSSSILAVSNFEGTQFIIKPLIETEEYANQKQNSQKVFQADQAIQSNQQNKNKIPLEVQKQFQLMIKKLNYQIRELYFVKKRLSQSAPFELNIKLALGLLIVFALGLSIFSISNDINQNKQPIDQDKTSAYVFFPFLLLLVFFWMVNVIYVVLKPYDFFYFDYEVMNKVSLVLSQYNEKYFREKNYTLVCDIETTWILLKEFNKSV